MRKIYQWIITACFVLFCISVVGTVPVTAVDYPEDVVPSRDKTSGRDRSSDITWSYDEATKTLSFTGKGTMFEYDGIFEEEDYDYFDIWYNAGLKEGKYYYDWQNFTEAETVTFSEGITSIGTMACMGMRNLKKVELPTTLRTIYSHAFRGCTSLQSVTIPDGVKDIYEDVFRDCQNLETAYLPETIKYIPWGMFKGCKQLKTIKIPEGVKKILTSCFAYSGLEKIVIPKNVKYISIGVFEQCKQLKSVKIKGKQLEEIGSDAFKKCTSLKSIKLPKSVVYIYSGAFAYSGLEKIVLPVRLGNIGFKVFQDCKDLKEITFTGTELEVVEKNTFKGIPKDCVIKVPKKKLKEYKKWFRKKGLSKKIKVKGI